MLLPKSSCVCIPCFKFVAPRICLVKYHFWLFWGPDIETEMGAVMHMPLKHPPDYMIPNIYGFMGLIP